MEQEQCGSWLNTILLVLLNENVVSETSFDQNTTYWGRGMGIRRVSNGHEDE